MSSIAVINEGSDSRLDLPGPKQDSKVQDHDQDLDFKALTKTKNSLKIGS